MNTSAGTPVGNWRGKLVVSEGRMIMNPIERRLQVQPADKHVHVDQVDHATHVLKHTVACKKQKASASKTPSKKNGR